MRDPESVGIDHALSSEAKLPVRFAGFILDLDTCTLSRDTGETMPLTRGEFALLRFFVTHPGRILSRDALLGATAGRGSMICRWVAARRRFLMRDGLVIWMASRKVSHSRRKATRSLGSTHVKRAEISSC
jgi:hypothetical protein